MYNQSAGFTVHNAPGAGPGPGQPPYYGYSSSGGEQDAPQSRKKSPQQVLAEEETSTKVSSPKRQMTLGTIEKYVGISSNVAQAITTFYSFVQICLGIHDTTLALFGPFVGLAIAIRYNPIYGLIGLVMGIGAQLLLQAGCQRISKKWKREHITQHQDQRFGIIKVALSDKVGLFFTGFGFIVDGLSDIAFVFAFHIPWYVCLLYGLMVNGMSTWLYYDGDERFHTAYMVWWRLEMAKKAWAKAVLEKSRLMQGLARDGKSLVPAYQSQ